MGDRRVREHAFEIRLRDREQVADGEREHAQHGQHVLPTRVVQRAEPLDEHAPDERERGDLGRRADVERHGRRRALIDVRQPHVERHRAELERDARDDEREREQRGHADAAGPREVLRERVELQRARDPVEQRDAVQQRSGRDRAEHEVLHRRLGRDCRVAIERDQRVLREREQLEPEVQREQAVRRDHDHDPEQPEQAQQEELALEQPVLLEVLARVQEHDADDDVGEHLQHARGRIQHVAAAECEHAMVDRRVQRDGRRADQREHRQYVRDVALVVAQEHVDEQHRADREREEDLRSRGD